VRDVLGATAHTIGYALLTMSAVLLIIRYAQ